MDRDPEGGWNSSRDDLPNGRPHGEESFWRWPVDVSLQLTSQLKSMERLVDPETGAILFRHPTLRGIPDLVVEGDGYTLEFIGPTLLCLDIQDPSGMARLLAEPLKAQLPVTV
jgi:hypothetical protein